MGWREEFDGRYDQLPIGASARDIPIGRTDSGAVVYAAPNGATYWAEPQTNALAGNASFWNKLAAIPKAIVGSAVDGFTAPGRALRGEPVTYGDVYDTAGMVQLGAAAMPAPKGALRSGALREIDNFDDIYDALRATDEDAFIRWSAGPQYDLAPGAVSRDYASGNMHSGLSALKIDRSYLPDVGDKISTLHADQDFLKTARDYAYLQGGGYGNSNRPHILFGKQIGFDSDGAASIRPTRYLGTLSANIQEKLLDDSIVSRLSAEASYLRGVNSMTLPRFGAEPGYFPAYTNETLRSAYEQMMNAGGPAYNLFRR